MYDKNMQPTTHSEDTALLPEKPKDSDKHCTHPACTIAPDGRWTMVVHNDDGTLTTMAEVIERECTDADFPAAIREMMRRNDEMMTWTVFENCKPGWVRSTLQTLAIPPFCVGVLVNYLRLRWEMSGQRRREGQGERRQPSLPV